MTAAVEVCGGGAPRASAPPSKEEEPRDDKTSATHALLAGPHRDCGDRRPASLPLFTLPSWPGLLEPAAEIRGMMRVCPVRSQAKGSTPLGPPSNDRPDRSCIS